MKTLLITGATGLIGKQVYRAFRESGYNILVVTTNVTKAKRIFDDAKSFVKINELQTLKDESIDVIINLAGKNLGSVRWNEKTKKEFYDSRIGTTDKLTDLISLMKNKPEVLVSASGVDYYGSRGETIVDESSAPGEGFLSKLTKDWEDAAYKAEEFRVRVVTIRTGFVISEEADGLQKMVLPFRFYAGGTIGSGEQYLSWVHIDDVRDIYIFAAENKNLRGPVNASTPNPVKMKDFAKAAGITLKRPLIFKVPEFAVKLAAGEMAEVILTGRKALPKKLLDAGFEFRYKNLYDALKAELK